MALVSCVHSANAASIAATTRQRNQRSAGALPSTLLPKPLPQRPLTTAEAVALLSGACTVCSVRQRCQGQATRACRRKAPRSRLPRPAAPGPAVIDFEELMELAAKEDAAEEINKQVEAGYSSWSFEHMQKLQAALSSPENVAAQRVAEAFGEATERRIGGASKQIEEIMASSGGEINQVNAGVRKVVREAESPMPLLTVLELNINQAEQEADEVKGRFFTHIRTILLEELEKKAPRVQALLSKLMRMEDSSIRENLLRHNLTPQEVPAPADFDDEDAADSEPKKSGLVKALVMPSQLAGALTTMVENVDTHFKATGGDVDEMYFETVDRIRSVAKEARLVIGDVYGEAELENFSGELTPVFRRLMAWKAEQQQEKQESEASEASADIEEKSA